jgi:hypothetical protein
MIRLSAATTGEADDGENRNCARYCEFAEKRHADPPSALYTISSDASKGSTLLVLPAELVSQRSVQPLLKGTERLAAIRTR